MTDTIIKRSGNSRFLRSVPNLATYAPTYDKLLELLTGDGLPVDLLGPNPAGCDVVGTDLTKENLLKDATAALYGKDSAATINDIFAAIRPLITSAVSTANSKLQCTTGSYSGTASVNHYINTLLDWKLIVITGKYSGYARFAVATPFALADLSGGSISLKEDVKSGKTFKVSGNVDQPGGDYQFIAIGT